MSTQDISCDSAKRLIQQGAQLIDVRSETEYQQHALPGALNLPLEILNKALHVIDKDNPVILYCRTGRRSGMAKMFLQSMGFDAIHNLGSVHNYHGCPEPEAN